MEKMIQSKVGEYFKVAPESVVISKFIHGTARPLSKVLFLATYQNNPLAIVKVARSKEGSKRLQNEMAGQQHGEHISKDIMTPRVFFSGFLGDHFFYAEEVVEGVPIGKDVARKRIEDIYQYQQGVEKGSMIPPQNLRGIFEYIKENPKLGPSSEINSRILGEMRYAYSHGDLTYMNVMESPKGIYIIDWDRYNERPIWGIDFVHYALRTEGSASYAEFSSFLDSASFIKEEDKELLRGAYMCDVALDYLEKNDHSRYQEYIGTISYEQ